MRLIDADVLKLELRRYQIESLIEHSEEKNVFDVINEQPTAFDREKVVAELENEMKFWEDSYDYQIGKEKARSYSHAIEIVRKGGVE